MWVNCKYRRLSHHGRGWRRGPGDLRDIAFHDIPPSPSVSRSGIPPHSKSHIMDHAHGRQQSDLKMKCFGLESKLFQPHNRCILTFPGNYGCLLGWGWGEVMTIWVRFDECRVCVSPGDNISITEYHSPPGQGSLNQMMRKISQDLHLFETGGDICEFYAGDLIPVCVSLFSSRH